MSCRQRSSVRDAWRKTDRAHKDHMKEGQKVLIRALWMSKALEDSENQGDEEPGSFAEHFDNYRDDSLVRIIATLYDATDGKGKMMGLKEVNTKRVEYLSVPHGTVVGMDKVASGADGHKTYSHFVNGAAGTYTICMELGIGEEGEEDCAGCCEEDKFCKRPGLGRSYTLILSL